MSRGPLAPDTAPPAGGKAGPLCTLRQHCSMHLSVSELVAPPTNPSHLMQDGSTPPIDPSHLRPAGTAPPTHQQLPLPLPLTNSCHCPSHSPPAGTPPPTHHQLAPPLPLTTSWHCPSHSPPAGTAPPTHHKHAVAVMVAQQRDQGTDD